jgi:hypothetical protein
MTDTMTPQNIVLSSWDTVYINLPETKYFTLADEPTWLGVLRIKELAKI